MSVLVRIRRPLLIALPSRHCRFYSTPLDTAPVPNVRKVYESADEAVKDVKSGDTILSGGKSPIHVFRNTLLYLFSSKGFGLCGTPGISCLRYFSPTSNVPIDTLIQALARRKEVQKITAVSNNAGVGERGLGNPSVVICTPFTQRI